MKNDTGIAQGGPHSRGRLLTSTSRWACCFLSVVALGYWSVSCDDHGGRATAPALAPTAASTPAGPSRKPVHVSAQHAREDIRELVQLLESSHPDPFTRIGGRVAYFELVTDTLRDIPATGLTRRELFVRMRPLTAAVRDGHTFLHDEWQKRDPRRVWLDLDPIEDRLVVVRVYERRHVSLLGCTLEAAQGVSAADLLARMANLRGFDNPFGNLDHLATTLSTASSAAELLATDESADKLTMQLKRADGAVVDAEVAVSATAPGDPVAPPTAIKVPEANAGDMAWSYLNPEKDVAYLRLDSMMRYREAFEVWRSTGYTANLASHLDDVTARAAPDARATSVDEKIALVPSATELLIELFTQMRVHRTEHLIVDLRKNRGGNSTMDLIVQYFLYPLDEIIDADDGYQIPRYSRLYYANYQKSSAAELADKGLRIGDYDFENKRIWQRIRDHGRNPDERARALEELARWAEKTPTFNAVFSKRELNASWSPKVIVLTSARTYSAGFNLATALYRHGAKLVGVPSSQAGNCFIDTLSFTLTHSRLSGNLSFEKSLSFPNDPTLGYVLRPHVELDYERFARLEFDPHAAVRLALENRDTL